MVLIAPVVVGLAGILAWFLLFGVRQSFETIRQAILHPSAGLNVLKMALTIGPTLVNKLIHHGEKRVGDEARGSASVTTGFLSHVAGVIEYVAFTGAYIAEGTLEAFYALRHATIPKAVRAGTLPTTKTAIRTARLTRAEALRAAHGNAALARVLVYENRLALRAQATADRALAIAAAPAIPVALPYPRTAPAEWATDAWRSIKSRMGRVEKIVLGGALAAVGIRALTRYLPWYRCTNVNRTMRQLCRTPFHFLDDILALAADFFVLSNICRVIPWLEAAFEEVAAPLIGHLARVGAGVCGAGYQRSEPLTVPPLHIAPVAGLTLHLP